MLLCLPLSSKAADEPKELGFWFEAQIASRGATRFIGQYERNLFGPLGIYILAEQETSGYREAYTGPTIKPFEWLQLGVGIGLEHIQELDDAESLNSTRYNAFFSIEYEKIALYGSFENGDGGPWHELEAIYNFSDTVGAGVMDEAFRGFGPRLELNFDKVQLWGAILHDRDAEQNNAVLAINFSF